MEYSDLKKIIKNQKIEFNNRIKAIKLEIEDKDSIIYSQKRNLEQLQDSFNSQSNEIINQNLKLNNELKSIKDSIPFKLIFFARKIRIKLGLKVKVKNILKTFFLKLYILIKKLNIVFFQKKSFIKDTYSIDHDQNNLAIKKINFDNTFEKYYPYENNKKIDTSLKLIAFYLPQFHPFKENDKWWGKGFTEWTNVSKASPKYFGHYQPKLPADLGFYDLRLPEILSEQWRYAENYGIHAFSFYFYWFSGKILMEKPLLNLLESKKINLKFCLTWANENWTRRWDGLEDEKLITQNYSSDDSIKFIKYISKYFKDERYIKVNGKPVLIIYSPHDIPNINTKINLWRDEIKKHGFEDLYLISCATNEISKIDTINILDRDSKILTDIEA